MIEKWYNTSFGFNLRSGCSANPLTNTDGLTLFNLNDFTDFNANEAITISNLSINLKMQKEERFNLIQNRIENTYNYYYIIVNSIMTKSITIHLYRKPKTDSLI